jgi:sulfite oxidase
MPVNSVITCPESGSTFSLDKLRNGLEMAGYALPQADDGPVVRVEVSMDQGRSWDAAEIIFPSCQDISSAEGKEKYRWAWSIWKYRMPVEQVRTITKGTKIWSRAIDAAGNVQDNQVQWNYRGIHFNHRTIKDSPLTVVLGVGYNGYGEVKNLTILDSDELSNGVQRMNINGVRSRV